MKLKNFMLLAAASLMAFSMSSCSKDDGDEKKIEDEKWDFTNGLSELKDDGKTVAFATSSFDAFMIYSGIDPQDLDVVGKSVQNDFKQSVFKFSYDKDENITSDRIIVSCTTENSTKALASLLMSMKQFKGSDITVNGTQIVIEEKIEADDEALKVDVEYLYYYLYGVLNNDGSKASISDLSYDGIEYTWTITYGGTMKAMGAISITKHYAADDRPGKPVEAFYAEILCKDEKTANLIGRLDYGYDEDCTYSVDGSTVYVQYTPDYYSDMKSEDIVEEYNFDKDCLSLIYQ